MSYGWMITVDHISGGDETGVRGPCSIDAETLERLQKGEGHKFRMYDDDDELYYDGLFIGDASSEDGFIPLDDFGTPNAGATRIDYLEDGRWVTL